MGGGSNNLVVAHIDFSLFFLLICDSMFLMQFFSKKRKCFFSSIILASLFIFFGCFRNKGVSSLNEENLFSIEYGNFEDEINLFDITAVGSLSTYMTMHNGFFYIANGESKKILELNSYGDLLNLFYNDEEMESQKFADKNIRNSTKKAISYPFNHIGPLAVDSRNYLYVSDVLPVEKHERDEKQRLLLDFVILRFDSDGNFVDYIGQQGPGGTPFPFVKNIFVTKLNELVVLCTTNDGPVVYWFNEKGFLLYKIPITQQTIPSPGKDEGNPLDGKYYSSVGNVVPDWVNHRLFIHVDYYQDAVDADSKILNGVDYSMSLLYQLDLETKRYEAPLEIPSYENVEVDSLSKETYEIPYDFLGVTDSGWFFFIVPDDNGYLIQMVQPDGQRILKRSLSVDHAKNVYASLSLSESGIISGLFIQSDSAKIKWWRTDSLIY